MHTAQLSSHNCQHVTSTSCDDWSVAWACDISSAGSSPGQLQPAWSVGLADQEHLAPPLQLLLAAVQLGAGSSLETTPEPAQSVGLCVNQHLIMQWKLSNT